jgi:hypothetical protein
MATFSFVTFTQKLNNMGFLDVVLPFLLFFAIIFSALQKTKVLGDPKKESAWKSESDNKKKAVIYAAYTGKKYNVVVSLIIALLSVIPHVIGGRSDGTVSIGGRSFPDPVQIVNNSLPSVAIWIIAILMVFLIMGVMGANIDFAGAPIAKWVAGLAALLVLYIFGSAAGLWKIPQWLQTLGLNNPNNQFGLVLILLFAVGVYFVVKD